MVLALWTSAALATEVQIPALAGSPGNTVEVPVKIDEIDNLAGIKLVMSYDAGVLLFKKAAKTTHSSSLMHIVNDKIPGLLIVVMAGARGIKGKDFALLTLTFQVKPEVETPGFTEFKISEVQLMSDKLKDIKAAIKTEPFRLVPPESVRPADKEGDRAFSEVKTTQTVSNSAKQPDPAPESVEPDPEQGKDKP